jgi:hypothetical protein
MKKIKLILGIITMSAVTLISNQAHAQKGGGDGNTFEVGSLTFSIGAGLGRNPYGGGGLGYYGGSYGYAYGSGIGAKAVIERGMWQLGPGVLSLGLEAGGAFSTSGGYKSNIIITSVRAAYHFGWNVDNLDTYAGPSLGPGFRSYDYYVTSTTHATNHAVVFAPGFFVGGTYWFSPNIGVNVEAGYDITEIQGGIIFKLK